MMYRLVLVAIAWIFIGDAAYPQEDVPNLTDPNMIAAGHDLVLQKKCAHCHGEGGRGGGKLPPRRPCPQGGFPSNPKGPEREGLPLPGSPRGNTEPETR